MHRTSRERNGYDTPILQQIFEDRLKNVHRKWKEGTLDFRQANRVSRTDTRRLNMKEIV